MTEKYTTPASWEQAYDFNYLKSRVVPLNEQEHIESEMELLPPNMMSPRARETFSRLHTGFKGFDFNIE